MFIVVIRRTDEWVDSVTHMLDNILDKYVFNLMPSHDLLQVASGKKLYNDTVIGTKWKKNNKNCNERPEM